MKLLRTTTTDSTGLFNAFLNQDLQIPPYSKIALGQLSSAVRKDVLVIDGTNDTVQFKTKDAGDLRIIKLAHGNYDTDNKTAFLEQLADAIDKAIGVFAIDGDKVTIADGNNIGKGCRLTKGVHIPNAGKVILQIHQSKSWSHYPELTSNIFKLATVPQLEITGTTSEANIRLKSALDTVDNGYTRATFFSHNMCQGVGVFRVRLNNLAGTSATNSGYTIGLTSINPATFMAGSAARALTLNDLYVGISAINPFDADGNYGVITSSTGTSTVTPAAPAVTPNNAGAATEKDVASIEICNGRLRCVIYQNDAGNDPHTRVIHDVPYDSSVTLYGVIVVHGKSSQTDLRDIKFTGNPFTDIAPTSLSLDSTYLGASTPSRQITASTNNTLIWPNISVSQWFGYEQLTYIKRGNPNVDFVADSIFKASIENDLYLVEMLNIQLESYDTFEQGRKNILAVVPYDDVNAKVTYDPNNLVFLDLNNKETINLTSVKFRLVRADYSAPELIGITTAVLYFKSKDEL
tara:strand:+ start:733 stop:2289 length:1557 start_codon:yes stop_codon:yes gene_type:complete